MDRQGMRPRRGCAAGSHARADCWCESAANAPPGRRSKRECLLDCRFHQLGGAAQAQATQLLDHSDGLLVCCREVLAGVDCLEHGCDLPHLGRGHVTEDVALPVDDGAVEKVRAD